MTARRYYEFVLEAPVGKRTVEKQHMGIEEVGLPYHYSEVSRSLLELPAHLSPEGSIERWIAQLGAEVVRVRREQANVVEFVGIVGTDIQSL